MARKRGRFEQEAPKKRLTGGKIALMIIAILLVIVIGVAIYGVVTYKSMINKVNIVTMPTQFEEDMATEAVETTAAAIETTVAATEMTTVETTIPPMTAEDIVNILVVGQAGRAGETYASGDTMILVSINKYTKTMTLTSFLRDTYVDLPDYRDSRGVKHTCGWNKLTQCYALGYSWGGAADAMAMTNICLRDNFGVEIDYNVEINFESFIKVVDLMGGVSVNLTDAEAEYLNEDWYQGMPYEAGWQCIDGTDALSYARMRKAKGDNESDIKRTARQRHLIECLLHSLKQQSLSDIQRIANEVLPMITTNMPADKITELMLELLPMLKDLSVEKGTCPVQTTYWNEYKETPDGYLPVLVFDKGQNTRLMRAITEGEIS